MYIFLTGGVCAMGECMASDKNRVREITFNEAGSSHGPLKLKKNVDFTCQSLERGLTAHAFGVFFQMADAILCFA